MEGRAPLNENVMDNVRPSERDGHWGKRAEEKPRTQAAGPTATRSVPNNSTKRAGGSGRGHAKRGRDTQQARDAQGWRWSSPVRSKKPRRPNNNRPEGKNQSDGGSTQDASNAEASNKSKSAAKWSLNRRVGGTAPNGNPQCWFAPNESESDPHRVAQRLKQIEYGKNSAGYKAYLEAVPKSVRRKSEPQTPDVHTKCSKRCFDGILRAWRRKLHQWDPQSSQKDGAAAQAPPSTPLPAEPRPSPLEPKPDDTEPVLWEDIEKMSLSTPRSWMEDVDSDISEPDSEDRVTIYTNELSPTPSEMAAHKSSDLASDLWGTPRSRLSPDLEAKDERPATPPSPYSPWAPWDASKRSFADALRSPLDVGNAGSEPAVAGSMQPSATEEVPLDGAEATLAPPTLGAGAGEATLAPIVTAAQGNTEAVQSADGPFTFSDAFATGALPQAGSPGAAAPKSLFGAGIAQPPVQRAEPSLTAAVELDADEHSISMRTIPTKGPKPGAQ